MTNQKELLRTWYDRASYIQRVQYRAALHYSRLNYWLGLPVVVIATLVGMSVFASIQEQPSMWVQILAGFGCVVAAVLSGLQTFLGLQDRAEKHRLASAKYSAIGRHLEQLLADHELRADAPLAEIRQRLDGLDLESPNVPLFIAAKHEDNQPEKHAG